MITSILLWFLYSFVGVITSPILLLPDVILGGDLVSSITKAGLALAPFDLILPVTTLLTVLGVFLTYELTYGGYKVTMWIIRRFPSQS